MAVLLNDVWHSAVMSLGCVSSRILWIKFKFSRVKIVWWYDMALMKEMKKKGLDSGTTSTGLRIE